MSTPNVPRDQPYLPLLGEVVFRPVFIIGEHRSGTTILYKLLAATGLFNYVTYYHITHSDELLYNHLCQQEAAAKEALQARFATLNLEDRGFDQIRVTPDLPEEYSFALKRGASLWYVPRLARRNLPQFMALCRKVQFVAGNDKPLLLKNPWDAANFLFLQQTFPNAHFIFIHRHPVYAINSKLKAVRSILAARNPYSALLDPAYARLFDRPGQLRLARAIFPSFGDLDLRILTRLAINWTRYFLQNHTRIPAGNQVSVQYETLCARPGETINQIIQALNLPPRQGNYESWINPRPLKLLPPIVRHKARIQRRLAPYMAYNQYAPL